MIDTVVLNIDFLDKYVAGGLDKKGRATGVVDLIECHRQGVKLMAGEISNFRAGGLADVSNLSTCWDSIASSNSSLAFKVFKGGESYWPHVQIKASVNKLLQGHNVFGSDNPEIILSLIQALNYAMPNLVEMLDMQSTEIKQIDCTYTAQVESQHIAKQLIQATKNIHSGQTRLSKNSHETTNYWGVSGRGQRSSRHKLLKMYLKWFEVQNQIKDITKKLKTKKDEYLHRQLEAMQTEIVQEFARNAVRFEASIMGDMLKRLAVPSNLGKFLDYAEDYNGNLIEMLWREAWKDIFEAFGGTEMQVFNDDEVEKQLFEKFKAITPNGNVTFSKAKRLHKFYLDFQQYGWEKLKETTNKATFYRNVDDLLQVVSKAQLQNMNGIGANVMPIIRVINLDFDNQYPAGYVEPESLDIQFANNSNIFKLHRAA